MIRLGPIPLTLFSLVPLNDRARDVIAHPNNHHLISTSFEGYQTLDIGFYIRPTSQNTLTTLGRCDSDITLQGASISRFQCSFEINPSTGVIMLYDRSNSQTTQVFGENACKFETGRLRRVVVAENLNTKIGIGGQACDLIHFQLRWHNNADEILKKLSVRQLPYELENPCVARTVDEERTAPPTRLKNKFDTPGGYMSMRYKVGGLLGAGTFGEVYRATDIDSGNTRAVKIIKRPEIGWNDTDREKLRREVTTLASISHVSVHCSVFYFPTYFLQPHVVQYIIAHWAEENVKIFMALKEGSVEKLIVDGRLQKEPKSIANNLLSHMLQALDFLAHNEIVHRDVKPANILYTRSKNGYFFELTDFGICNHTSQAGTCLGTPSYMAPEMFVPGAPQTPKVDVWSLFVTMACTLDVAGFRQKPLNTEEDRLKAIFAAAKDPVLENISEMAIFDAKKRASAAQMLVKLYSGKGLTSCGFRLPPLDFSPAPISSKTAIQEIAQEIEKHPKEACHIPKNASHQLPPNGHARI